MLDVLFAFVFGLLLGELVTVTVLYFFSINDQ